MSDTLSGWDELRSFREETSQTPDLSWVDRGVRLLQSPLPAWFLLAAVVVSVVVSVAATWFVLSGPAKPKQAHAEGVLLVTPRPSPTPVPSTATPTPRPSPTPLPRLVVWSSSGDCVNNDLKSPLINGLLMFACKNKQG